MICLTVLYPKTTESNFDLDYYLSIHTKLVKDRLSPLGLISVDIERGVAGAAPDSPPAYELICRLNFESVEALQNAIGIHGAELIADIPKFTDVEPVMQISQIIVN